MLHRVCSNQRTVSLNISVWHWFLPKERRKANASMWWDRKVAQPSRKAGIESKKKKKKSFGFQLKQRWFSTFASSQSIGWEIWWKEKETFCYFHLHTHSGLFHLLSLPIYEKKGWSSFPTGCSELKAYFSGWFACKTEYTSVTDRYKQASASKLKS